MVVDTSAIIAILKEEPEAESFAHAMEDAPVVRVSAASYLEAHIVTASYRNPILIARLDSILDHSAILIEPVTADHARIARQAFRDYGRGSGHPANLNFGDCFSYALARATREPLLFKGQGFSRTDLASAVRD